MPTCIKKLMDPNYTLIFFGQNWRYCLRFNHLYLQVNYLSIPNCYLKQAWKLSAIKGEPNLSILWKVRQIHLKKPFSSQKVTSNLTQVFLDKKQFLQKSHYCQKAVSGQKVWSSLIKFDPFLTDLIKKKPVISIL